MFKVVFIARSTLYTVKGGDTVQVLQTAKHVAMFGVVVDIKLTNEKIEYEKYHLLHFFNITRPADILFHVKKSNKPFVVSTILVNYSEYDKFHRKGIIGNIFHFFSSDNIEYLKTIGRFLIGRDKLMTPSYCWDGQKKSIKKIISKATLLFTNSILEEKELVDLYNCSADCITVVNGIDPELFKYDNQLKKDNNLVLCVARIEGIKNQINLIKALNNTSYQLFVIGSPAPNQLSYYEDCKKIAASNITFIEHIPQHQLVGLYQKAKVHVLPSWFETCGLSSLEAGVMGCNIVVTDKGYTREYYENYAFYCDPVSPTSILKAVEKAAQSSFSFAFRKKILSRYTWLHAAADTVEAYHFIRNSRQYA